MRGIVDCLLKKNPSVRIVVNTVTLETLAELTEQMPLVAELDFPGDMTSYGIRFVDENGKTHVFRICQSLRNGALELQEE